MVVQVPKKVINYRIPFLSSGCSFQYLHIFFSDWNRNSKQDREVCLNIWSIMRPECISKSTKEQWELTALEFEIRANFAHCLGAVFGKHIREIKPEHSRSMFSCYKNFC
jgi:hypothetical protein